MRRVVRVVLIVLGSILSLAGLAAAVLIGPDNTVGTGGHQVTTDTAVVSTATSVLTIMGPTLHVAATVPDDEVFVGIGHPVDVGDYLDGVEHDQITEVSVPWSVELQRIEGEEGAPGADASSRDWWHDQAAGAGRQEVSAELGEVPLRLVIMRADGEAPLTTDVEFALQIDNLFTTALLVLAIGLVLLATGIFALRRRTSRRAGVTHLESEAVHS
jgi:hypothetical protein